jgi:hypothetical protein
MVLHHKMAHHHSETTVAVDSWLVFLFTPLPQAPEASSTAIPTTAGSATAQQWIKVYALLKGRAFSPR